VKTIVMVFEVEIPYDVTVDDKTLKEDFGNNIKTFCEFMYKEEGIFWDEEMKLMNAFTKNHKED